MRFMDEGGEGVGVWVRFDCCGMIRRKDSGGQDINKDQG